MPERALTPTLTLRPARAGDAPAIARVHTEAWQAAYRELLPAAVLERFTYQRRLALWRGLLDESDSVPTVEVADRTGTGPVGFAWLRHLAEPGAAFDGEIVSLNVLSAEWRRGVGRRLMAASAERLAGLGASSCYLWVYRDNLGARRFYEALAGRPIDRDVERFGDLALPTVAYAWRPLDRLIAAARRGLA